MENELKEYLEYLKNYAENDGHPSSWIYSEIASTEALLAKEALCGN